jgi:nucleotide-binding universal stress UspA family protein
MPLPEDPGPIVCGVEDSEESRRAVRVAAALAGRLSARLLLVHVRPPPDLSPRLISSDTRIARERAVEHGHQVLAGLAGGLNDDPRLRGIVEGAGARVEFGAPPFCLASAANQVSAELIVVGARGAGAASALLLGSVSQALAARASCPTLVVPPNASGESAAPDVEARKRSIVCGIDGSDDARSAARVAARLASALGDRLVLAHVGDAGEHEATAGVEYETLLEADGGARLRMLHDATRVTGDAEVAVSLVGGSPTAALEDLAARESAELIAVGTRGHGALKALALGSVSRTLAASASCPVLVVNERDRVSGAAASGRLAEGPPRRELRARGRPGR